MKGKLLSDLQPRLVWGFFEQLSRIPRCTKKEQKVRGASLECGVFMGVAPDLQMASIGPDIRLAHTPEEYVEIPSVALLWDVIRGVVAGMGELA